ncbi:transmembrane protein 192 isoform X2 [Cryptotermes secundus]|nr:transmembrane protein 192 isoform X2 [Cryptotermes secundus]XP_033608915.1 transmembrane protein 192 isoform X2 [Cryptotermes secundus]XP_033608916.1 transmembrane protein 192 isoform X2 [Cryptotermes secundus]
MVSLSRNYNTSSGGGVFFSDASLSVSAAGDDDDSQLLQPVLCTDMAKKFTPLNTVVAVTVELFLCVTMLATAIVLAVVWPENMERCAPYFIILYIHAAFWCVALIVDNHIRQKHHALRVNGYLEFYQHTHQHSRIPFYIVSLWNTVLLALSTAFSHLYKDFRQQCNISEFLKPVNYLCVFIAVETTVLAYFMVIYICKVIKFNRSKPPPDVQREEWMMNFIQDSYSGGEVGYRERGDHIHDLLEKQADLIRYLKDRNTKLSHKIMLLSRQIQGERA